MYRFGRTGGVLVCCGGNAIPALCDPALTLDRLCFCPEAFARRGRASGQVYSEFNNVGNDDERPGMVRVGIGEVPRRVA